MYPRIGLHRLDVVAEHVVKELNMVFPRDPYPTSVGPVRSDSCRLCGLVLVFKRGDGFGNDPVTHLTERCSLSCESLK